MDQRGGAADGPAPIVELAAITVDCLDLRPMIDFYAQAFGARTSHALGAVTCDFQPHRAQGNVVMLDPAGHPFCIGTRV